MSRLTFRNVQTDIAWQKQLRDRYIHEPAPTGVSLDVRSALVRAVSYHLAASIILKYEWLGTMAFTNVHYGIFFGMHCAGVCCFSVGNGGAGGQSVAKHYGLDVKDLIILMRGACVHWAPPNTNSKLVSMACKLLQRTTPCKLVIAYSDSDAGEIGTIYQACNWTYLGKGKPRYQYVSPGGRAYNHKLPDNLCWNTQHKPSWKIRHAALLQAGYTLQATNPKGRYGYILDTTDQRLSAHIEALRQPYPKRCARPLESEGAAHQAVEGIAI